jgi:DNA (cytosine-5)-methyltransferase 1
MTHASLFSGIGGFDLAAEWMGWENLFHCEWNEFGQRVLNHYWPQSTSYGDITKTDFTIWKGRVDILTGGFPCQDASIAKQHGQGQQGLQGSRTGLFWEMVRAIEEIRPRYIVAENVSNFLKVNGGADARTVFSELTRLGYNAEWRVCRASEVGAPHQRARLYIVAYPNSLRLQTGSSFFSNVRQEIKSFSWVLDGAAVQIFRGGAWQSEPPSVCVDDGIPSKLLRSTLQAYGNAIVPQVTHEIFKSIQDYENSTFTLSNG